MLTILPPPQVIPLCDSEGRFQSLPVDRAPALLFPVWVGGAWLVGGCAWLCPFQEIFWSPPGPRSLWINNILSEILLKKNPTNRCWWLLLMRMFRPVCSNIWLGLAPIRAALRLYWSSVWLIIILLCGLLRLLLRWLVPSIFWRCTTLCLGRLIPTSVTRITFEVSFKITRWSIWNKIRLFHARQNSYSETIPPAIRCRLIWLFIWPTGFVMRFGGITFTPAGGVLVDHNFPFWRWTPASLKYPI